MNNVLSLRTIRVFVMSSNLLMICKRYYSHCKLCVLRKIDFLTE